MVLKNLLSKLKNYHFLIFLPKYPLKILNRNYKKYLCNNSISNNYFLKHLPLLNVKNYVKYSSETIYSTDEEEIDIDDDFIEVDEQTDLYNKIVPIRNILNANSTDPLINQLNDSASVQDVFNFIHTNEETMDVTHISQAILVLWDLQKCFHKHNIFYQSESNINKLLSTNDFLKNYVNQVNTHQDFQKLLKLVENNYQHFSLDALTCSILYLNRMGVKISDKIMQDMITRCENEITKSDKNFPLTALSRFTVTIFSHEDSYWSINVSKNALPIIISRLETCDNAEDLKLLTICLHKMGRLVTNNLLSNYKNIVERLISTEKITSSNHRTVLKVIAFLNQAQWHQYNFSTIQKFLNVLKTYVDKLSDKELVFLFKVFQMQKEPADMLEEIQKSATNRLSKVDDTEGNLEISLDLMSCIVSFSSPLQRPKFEKFARRYIKKSFNSPSLTSLYKILYHIKSTDSELCNTFWDRALKLIKTETSHTTLNKILNLCHKYIHFNNDVGHRYRYYKFEKSVIDLLLYELEFGVSGSIPSKFSRIATYIIAYNNDLEVLETITKKIIEMQHQFSSIDCLNISKGLKLAVENANYKNPTHVNKHFNNIITVLNNCTKRQIENKNNNLPNINMLMRGYIFRKADVHDDLFRTLINFYLLEENKFSSHIIKDLTFSLQYNKCLVPEAVDKMTDYVIKMKESILGNTVDKLLYLCYYLGYTPNNAEEFLNISSDLIIRDKERFSGLTFLQSALSLCFFHKLPESLVKHIFSVHFLEKLDEELSHCYAKTTYPIRVRDHMMQLNRAVCLDYPGEIVPWFHQKYVEELQKQEPRQNYFHQKVFSVLLGAVKNQDCVSTNVYTPYGYHLNFEINLEAEGTIGNSMSRKIALLVLNNKAFTALNKNLKGYYQMRQRHLEILGYEILYEIQEDWKELYTHENCVQYMVERLWPTRKNIQQNSMS